MEGGEEESSTLGTVWYYAWEYGGEFVPLVGSGRGFKRSYDEGSTLGMAWNGLIFGVEATGVGAALGLIGKGGKAAVATSKVAASGLRPMVSGMASAAKAKAVEAVSVAKSTVSDAVGAVGNKLDGLGERLAGVFWGGAKKVSDEVLSAPINGWKSSQTWNTAANSRILRKNMGALAKKGEEAHHIIQSTHPRAARAREILETYQIDINSAVNGVSLPPNGPRPSHRGQGLHSYSAIDRITDRLQLATEGIEDWANARERVLEALDSIRAEILDGDFP